MRLRALGPPRAIVRPAAVLACLAVGFAGCSPSRAPAVTPVVLHGTKGAPVSLDDALHAHELTVVSFFSAHCPCQRAHDARLRDLIATSTLRGVGFLVVDSEESATVARDSAEARERGYPILLDEDGKLARSLDAEYATYSVLLDRAGKILYRGGFDSDKTHLRADRRTYLEDAVEDALAHRPLRRPTAKTLGCTLEVH